MSRLDELLRQAREAEPDDLHPAEVERAVSHAAVTGRARHRAWAMRRITTVAGVSAALAAAAAVLWMLGPASEPSPTPAPTVAEAPETPGTAPIPEPAQHAAPTPVELDTGDRLLATHDARYTVQRATPRERRVELGAGSVLFDVRPLEDSTFTVVTADARVVVLGTVFTVQADEGGTTVRVYEGRVRVEHEGETRLVERGGSTRVGDDRAARGIDPLREPAREAAAVRLATAETTPEPTPPPVHAERAARSATPAEPVASAPSADEVRALLASRDPRDATLALERARERTAAGDLDPWSMLEADALRALRRPREAAMAYARAAEALPSPRHEQAGYLAARQLAALTPSAALAQLDAADVTAPGSPLRERGLALRVQLLTRLGRDTARNSAAREYLSLYPDGSRAPQMRAALGGENPVPDP